MRFEVPFLILQSLGFLYAFYRYDPRTAFTVSILLIYGPAASLLKFTSGSVVIPLGSFAAVLAIFFTIKCTLPRNLFYYLVSVFFGSILISVINFDLYIITMTLHFLIYASCGLLLGNYVATRNDIIQYNFVRCYCDLSAIYFASVIIVRMFLVDGTGVLHFRDVGFGLSPLFAIFLVFSHNIKKISAVSSLQYIILSQTRSLIGLLMMGLYIGRKAFSSRRLRIGKILFYISCIIISISIFYTRFLSMEYLIGSESDLISKLSLVSRLNGALVEWNNFINNPIFGNGIAYYEEEYRLQKLAEQNGTVELLVAYNHVGILSVAAQGGIILLILLIFVPFLVFVRLKSSLINNDSRLTQCSLILLACFLISFLISGSPVVKDFSNAILYYFIIGYLFRRLDIQKRKNCV